MKKKVNKNLIIMAAIFFAGTMFPKAYSAVDESLQKFRTLVNVMDTVKENYVDETKTEDMVTNAMRGVMSGLDPFSEFLDKKEYADLKAGTKGEFGGIGVRLLEGDGYLEIASPMPGTPAYEAGFMPKDRIVEVDGVDVGGLKIDAAVEMMRGKPGTKVKITIERKKEGEEFERLPTFTLKRAMIVPEVIHYKMLENNTGYIYVVEFGGHTMEKFESALSALKKQGMDKLIMDVRFNPGGLLNSAVEMAGKFLGEEKMIVFTQGRKPEFYQEYRAPKKADWPDMPVILLVNEASASGSEILAGALQDHKRAVIIGHRSFGKASVQQLLALGDGSALRLTIARYYTPLGRLIHRDVRDKTKVGTGGIVPDVTVEVKLEDVYKILTAYGNRVYTPGSDKPEEGPALPEDSALLKAAEIINNAEEYQKLLGKGIEEK